MNQRNASMTVIGAGSYGTALAITLARNGHEVVLWGHDPEHIATLERDRCNAAFLPDVPFPDTRGCPTVSVLVRMRVRR